MQFDHANVCLQDKKSYVGVPFVQRANAKSKVHSQLKYNNGFFVSRESSSCVARIDSVTCPAIDPLFHSFIQCCRSCLLLTTVDDCRIDPFHVPKM
jgi:hypothetical protein